MHAQAFLRAKGVEVVEFDFLTPEAVADYCYDRGFLQVRAQHGTGACVGFHRILLVAWPGLLQACVHVCGTHYAGLTAWGIAPAFVGHSTQ